MGLGRKFAFWVSKIMKFLLWCLVIFQSRKITSHSATTWTKTIAWFMSREHSYMKSGFFCVFLTYLPTLIKYFTTNTRCNLTYLTWKYEVIHVNAPLASLHVFVSHKSFKNCNNYSDRSRWSSPLLEILQALLNCIVLVGIVSTCL